MDFAELRSRVLEVAPGLKKILATRGGLSLLSYHTQTMGNPPTVSIERQKELLASIEKRVRLIDPGIVPAVLTELREHYTVSTGDHHGPLTHPFSVTGQWSRLAALGEQKKAVNIVLSCSSISLNNSSFPRGHFFHTRSGEELRVSFFSLRERHHPVYGLAGYGEEDFRVLRDHLVHQDISSERLEILRSTLDTIFGSAKVLSLPTYAEQISYTNYWLWKKIAGQENAACLFLDQESIVNELLAEYHLGQNTILNKLVSDAVWYQAFERLFDGCVGAFSFEERKGTFLFWALVRGERKSLLRQDAALVSEDGEYMVELTPEALGKALGRKELIPSMALCYIVLSFYYGLRCGGGFLQVSYLADMKKRYEQLLMATDALERELEMIRVIETDYLAADFACLNLQTIHRMVGASSFDFLLYQDASTAEVLKTLLRSCTLGEAVDELMPEFYKILFHETPSVAVPTKFPPVLYAK